MYRVVFSIQQSRLLNNILVFNQLNSKQHYHFSSNKNQSKTQKTTYHYKQFTHCIANIISAFGGIFIKWNNLLVFINRFINQF